MRGAIEAVLADERVTPGELRVFLAVLAHTASWSRLSDTITRRELAGAAGVSERTVPRALRRLAKLGIRYEPGSGRGNHTRVGLAKGDTGPVDNPAKGDTQDGALSPQRVTERVTDPAVKGDRALSRKGDTQVTTSREVLPRRSEGGPRAGAREEPTPTEVTYVEPHNPTPVERAMTQLGITGQFDKLGFHTQDRITKLAEKLARGDAARPWSFTPAPRPRPPPDDQPSGPRPCTHTTCPDTVCTLQETG